MLVEINLLPQKEPKKINLIITLSSLLVIMILVGAYYLWQINSTKDEVASLESQIAMTNKVVENHQQTNNSAEASNSVSQLKSAIDWANNYPIQTLPVMKHLTSLLPERGFIQSFAYTEAGTITLTVQFDSAREAAYFLDDLDDSKWITEASLSSLATSETAASTAASTTASTTSQTNTISLTTTEPNQTTSTNTTAGATNDTSTAATSQTPNSQTVAATGTTTNVSSQTAAGTTNSTQGTAAAPTTNISNVNTATNSTAPTSTASGTNTNENILPRYTGQFEIKLDKEYVKKEINKSKTEKGVTGS